MRLLLRGLRGWRALRRHAAPTMLVAKAPPSSIKRPYLPGPATDTGNYRVLRSLNRFHDASRQPQPIMRRAFPPNDALAGGMRVFEDTLPCRCLSFR